VHHRRLCPLLVLLFLALPFGHRHLLPRCCHIAMVSRLEGSCLRYRQPCSRRPPLGDHEVPGRFVAALGLNDAINALGLIAASSAAPSSGRSVN
jgi:hypothetical protein